MIYVCDSIQNRKSITRSGAIRPRMIADKAMTMATMVVAMVEQAEEENVAALAALVGSPKPSQTRSRSTAAKLETNEREAVAVV